MGAGGYRLRSWARAGWRGALALALVVALAGGVALTLVAGAARTLSAPERYRDALGFDFDTRIEQSHGEPRSEELAGLDATAEMAAASFVFGGLFPPGSAEPIETLVFAGTQEALGGRVVEGRGLDPSRSDEFVASRLFVETSNARLGDQYEVMTFTQAQADEFGFNASSPDGPALRATLVGTFDVAGDLNDDYPLALLSPRLLDEGDVGVAATIVVARLEPGSTLDDLRAELDELPGGDVFSLEEADPVSSEVRAAVSAQAQGLLILGLIVAVATVAVLGQLLNRQLRLTDVESMVLASLGAGSRYATSEPALRTAFIAPIGAVVGALLAFGFSGTFPIDFVRRVEPDPGLRFDALVLVVGPVVLAAVLVAWVYVAVRLDSRHTERPAGVAVVERLARAVPSALVSTAVRLAFTRTVGRARGTTSSLVGLSGVCAVLFGALTFGANLSHLVGERNQYGVNFDVAVGQGESEISRDIRDELEESGDVAALTLYGTTSVDVGSASLDVVGMAPVRGGLLPDMLGGRLPRAADEIAIGAVSARQLDVAVGDALEVRAANGSRTLIVTGLAVVPPVGGADGVGRSAVVTEEGFLDLDGDARTNTGAVRIAPDAPPGAIERIGEIVGGDLGAIDTPSSIINLERVRSIPFLVAAAVGLLALLSLGHVMLLSVRRRRLDHAILRALGATPRWLGGVVHWQATLTTVAAVAVALPLGVVLGRSVFGRLVDNVGARDDIVLPLAWLGLAFLALVVLANVVSAIPARRSRRTPPTRLLTRS